MLPLAVKALGVSPRESIKRNEGQVGVAVTCAGQTICSGDQRYADADGVIILDVR
ncbi:hypothetical protein RCF34_20980 [Pseudomonas sp. 102515]|uniref:RraA family protein n=1 Tax=Pseudomonas sp. 102515 TaxID=3071568 RepID=UPI0028024B51|nr:hypothetical protein [Pseudomonas sp. 102515]MDQ7915589.1 hypothetical protein [Pseudomonas sp. 102515]